VNRTYCGACLENTGCYTDRQIEEVDKNDNWAYPGCAHINDELVVEQNQKKL